MIPGNVSRPAPQVRAFGRGVLLGTATASLVAAEAASAVYAGRQIDPNHKPESAEESARSDVFSACAAAYVTRRLLMTESMPLATRVGASMPAAVAAGLAASWVYQKSGPTMRELMEAVKSLL